MEKKVILLFILLFTLLLCGCDPSPNNYLGKYPELVTEAMNSMLGIDNIFENKVIPIEEDSYGRIMYLYVGKSIAVGDEIYDVEYLYAVLICQQADEEYVYYYPDDNLILYEDPLPHEYKDKEVLVEDLPNSVTQEQIEALKQRNDWGKPIEKKNCVKVEITRWEKESRGSVISTDTSGRLYNQMFEPREEIHYTSYRYLTEDIHGRCIYLLREMKDEKQFGRSYIVLFNPDETYDLENGIMELEDVYNYQDDLKMFKERNNWNRAYYKENEDSLKRTEGSKDDSMQ